MATEEGDGIIEHLREAIAFVSVTDCGLEKMGEEIARLRAELSEQDLFILHFTDAKRNGDWACVQCKPHSDMIKDGFRCGWHRAEARQNETT